MVQPRVSRSKASVLGAAEGRNNRPRADASRHPGTLRTGRLVKRSSPGQSRVAYAAGKAAPKALASGLAAMMPE